MSGITPAHQELVATLVATLKGFIARAVAEGVASVKADELKAEITQLKRRVDELEQQKATRI